MSRQDHTPATDEQREQFLAALAAGESIVAAAGSSSLRRKLYRIRDTDPEFALEWKQAYQEGTDALTNEARRRAMEGTEDFRFGPEGAVFPIRKYSDTLLMFLIKQRDPTYRDNTKLEVSGPAGGPVQLEHRGVKLTDVLNVAREAGVEPRD